MKVILCSIFMLVILLIGCSTNQSLSKEEIKKPTREQIDRKLKRINKKYGTNIQVSNYDSVTYKSYRELESKAKELIEKGIFGNEKDSLSD